MAENKLGVMPVSKLIWNMSLPIIASMLVQALYNIVDSVFVSWVSEASLTAVSLAFPAQNLMISLAAGTAVGVNALLGRALGAGERQRADRVAVNGLFLAFVGFAVSCVLGLTCAGAFLRSQTQVEEIVVMGEQYLHIVMGCSFALFGQIMLERLLQGTGRSLLSMYTQGLGAIVNIILDPVFIFVFDMGVSGAAIATVISQIASCVIGFAYMHRKYTLLRFSLRELRLDVKTAGRILHVGAPMAIQQSIVSCGFLFLQRLVNLYGESMIASYTVASRMENILLIPILGVQNTMATFAGQNMGAQRPDRVAKGLGQGVLVSLSMTLVLCLCQILGISLIIRAFQLDEAAAAICRLHLFSSAVAIPIFAVYFPANGMCQGVGEGFYATFFALLALGLRVIFAYALHNTALFGYTSIWWSQAMAWTVTLIVCYAHFFRGKWKTKSLIS